MKSYLKPQAGWLIRALILAFVAALAAVAVQFIKGRLLDEAIARDGTRVLRLIVLLLAVILFEIGCYYVYNRCRGNYQTGALAQLRKDFFSAQLEKPQCLQEDQRQGEVLAGYTDQIDTVYRQLFQNFPLLAEIILKILIVSTMLFILDARIALLTLLLATTPLYIPKLVQKHLEKAQKAHTEAFARHLGRVTEWLSSLMVIQNYMAQSPILSRFNTSNLQVRQKHLDMLKLNYLSSTVSTCLSYLSHFVILAYAAWLVASGSFSAGDFFIAVGMIDQMSWPILGITHYLQEMIAARPILRSLLAEMASRPAPEATPIPLPAVNQICAQKAAFSYPDSPPLFSGLSFQVQSGQKCLITGKSGGGKTTLMGLLLALDSPTSGQICYNNIPAARVQNLFELVTVMRQQPALFEDSLRNNLSLYQDIPEEQMMAVLRQVNLSQFASPEGLDHMIREGGSNLSGGEKRRICLARTLLKGSPVMILDEPLAEVDPDTVNMIEELIINMKGTTLFLVSHQVSPRFESAFDLHIQVG